MNGFADLARAAADWWDTLPGGPLSEVVAVDLRFPYDGQPHIAAQLRAAEAALGALARWAEHLGPATVTRHRSGFCHAECTTDLPGGARVSVWTHLDPYDLAALGTRLRVGESAGFTAAHLRAAADRATETHTDTESTPTDPEVP